MSNPLEEKRRCQRWDCAKCYLTHINSKQRFCSEKCRMTVKNRRKDLKNPVMPTKVQGPPLAPIMENLGISHLLEGQRK